MVICGVCELVESRYKCPGCLIRYCSLPCFKTHKLGDCATVSASSASAQAAQPPSDAPNLATLNPPETYKVISQEENPHIKRMLKEIAEEDRLSKSTLDQLGKSGDLNRLLENNPSLQHMLSDCLDVRNRREAHDKMQFLISQEPQFASLASTCLDITANRPK